MCDYIDRYEIINEINTDLLTALSYWAELEKAINKHSLRKALSVSVFIYI